MKEDQTLSMSAKNALKLFSMLLEKERRKKGYSQKDLAQRAGVSRFSVQNILKGEPSVSIGTYFEIAVILGVPLFTDNSHKLASMIKQVEEVISLLPSHVHLEKEILDDNF